MQEAPDLSGAGKPPPLPPAATPPHPRLPGQLAAAIHPLLLAPEGGDSGFGSSHPKILLLFCSALFGWPDPSECACGQLRCELLPCQMSSSLRA